MIDVLLDALLDCLIFLEVSGDEVVDPDAAVTVMESITFAGLTDAERADLIARVLARAEVETRSEVKDFLLGFPDAFGLSLDVDDID